MSDYIKRIDTADGDKQIDYTALANLPTLQNFIVGDSEIEISAQEDIICNSIIYIADGNKAYLAANTTTSWNTSTEEHYSVGIALEDITSGNIGLARVIANIDVEKPYIPTIQYYTVNIDATGWTQNEDKSGYYKNVDVEGIFETDMPEAYLILDQNNGNDINALCAEAWSCLTGITTSNGSITLYASENIFINFTIGLKVVK